MMMIIMICSGEGDQIDLPLMSFVQHDKMSGPCVQEMGMRLTHTHTHTHTYTLRKGGGRKLVL